MYVFQGKAKGDRGTLWIRGRLQQHLRSLGSFLDTHAGKVLFVSLLVIGTFCVGLKSATFHSSIDQLWVSDGGGQKGAAVVETHHGDASGTAATATTNTHPQLNSDLLSTHQMIVQTAVDPESSLLNPRGLLEHLKLVQQATQVTVNLFDM